jgi:hypothetical protein
MCFQVSHRTSSLLTRLLPVLGCILIFAGVPTAYVGLGMIDDLFLGGALTVISGALLAAAGALIILEGA